MRVKLRRRDSVSALGALPPRALADKSVQRATSAPSTVAGLLKLPCTLDLSPTLLLLLLLPSLSSPLLLHSHTHQLLPTELASSLSLRQNAHIDVVKWLRRGRLKGGWGGERDSQRTHHTPSPIPTRTEKRGLKGGSGLALLPPLSLFVPGCQPGSSYARTHRL